MALKEGVFAWFFPMRKVDVGNQPVFYYPNEVILRKKEKEKSPRTLSQISFSETLPQFGFLLPPLLGFATSWLNPLQGVSTSLPERSFNTMGRNWTFVEKFRGRQTLKIEVPNRFQVCNKSIVDI